MERLERIQIAGFKSIRDQSVDLGDLNVLIGANGAGKSNFIEVFRLVSDMTNGNLQFFVARAGGADRLLYFGSKTTEHLQILLRFESETYRCRLAPSANGTLFFADEMIYFADVPEPLLLGTGHQETALSRYVVKSAIITQAEVFKTLSSLKVYHFHDTSPSARVKQVGDLADNVALRPDASNLAAFLYRLQETVPEAFRNVVDAIRLVAPFFGDFDLQPDRLNPDKIRLEWHEIGSDTYFDAHSLSDGTLRFICLATLLLQPEPPALILIDEPELGLHPYAINVLAGLFRSAAERSQLIVSTQSVTLVNQLSPEDVIVVDREEHESVFRRPSSTDLESWLDGYALGELWEKNVLGGRPRP